MADAGRQALIAKIKALLSKTVANGCTEEEALSALTLARKWITEHDVTAAEMELDGEEIAREDVVKTDYYGARRILVGPVAAFCNCVGFHWRANSYATSIAGTKPEAIFAHWLLDTLDVFVERETVRAGLSHRLRNHFALGCARRIAWRLEEMTPKPATGKGLVVVRDGLIKKKLAEDGIELSERDQFKIFDQSAYDAGQRAGDRAQFNRPIDGMGPRKQLR
jgi:hypothetical protein